MNLALMNSKMIRTDINRSTSANNYTFDAHIKASGMEVYSSGGAGLAFTNETDNSKEEVEAIRPFLPLAEIAEEELAYDFQQQRQNLASDEMLLHIEENHRPQKDNYY